MAGGIAAGAAAAYVGYKPGKWLVKKVGEVTANLNSDGYNKMSHQGATVTPGGTPVGCTPDLIV